MAVKFIREIVVSSLATALVTAVYTHGPDLKAIGALTSASPAAPVADRQQGSESLAQFQARIASAHVGKSSPPSAIVETPGANAASANAEPVWPPQDKGAARAARASTTGKAASLKVSPTSAADALKESPPPAVEALKVSPPAADRAESKPAPAPEAPAVQAEAAPPSYAARIADKLKDYVWNPGASVVNGVSSGVSTVTNKITSFVKKQPS
ncbi:MAG: hypothetical protein WAK01_13030 [Methylocystis sp.]